jgi:hypothetical protein
MTYFLGGSQATLTELPRLISTGVENKICRYHCSQSKINDSRIHSRNTANIKHNLGHRPMPCLCKSRTYMYKNFFRFCVEVLRQGEALRLNAFTSLHDATTICPACKISKTSRRPVWKWLFSGLLRLVGICRRFRGSCCLNHHGLSIWSWRQQLPLKHR